MQLINKFSSFFAHINIFSSEAEDPAKLKIREELLAIEQEIDTMINTKNHDQLSIIIENKVKLTFEQSMKIILEDFWYSRYKNSYYDCISEHKDKIANFILQVALNMNEELKDQKKFLSKGNKFIEIQDEFKKISSFLENFGLELYKDSYKELSKAYLVFKDMKKRLYSYQVPLQTTAEDIKNVMDVLTPLYNELSKKNAINLAKKANELQQDASNIEKNIVSGMVSKVKDFEVKQLPESAQELFNEIKLLFNYLHTNDLAANQNIVLENLYIKRLPQVIGEYIIIPQKYRDQLKSNSENPESLLLDSLKEIKNNMSEVMDEIQSFNLRKMKVSNRYLKNI